MSGGERSRRLEELYLAARDRPEAERAAFVAAAAEDDPTLAEEVMRLLDVDPAAAEARFRPASMFGGGPLTEGVVFAGYRIVAPLGSGAARVFRAVDAEGREVALKVLEPIDASVGNAGGKFRQEAEILTRLDHEGIVPLLGVGEEGGRLWYAMELVEGPTLRVLLEEARSGRFDPRCDLRKPADAVRVIVDVLRSLHVVHELGVLHRDVKPENIVLGADGRPRLIDFGIARDLAQPGTTRQGETYCSPNYMSPEQSLRRSERVGYSTDLFSAGAVLFELLTLRQAFPGDELAEVTRRIRDIDPPSVRRFNPAVPRPVARVCAAALAKNPDYRFPSALVFAQMLEVAMRGVPVSLPREPLLQRARRKAAARPALLALLVGVLLAGGTAALLWPVEREPRARLVFDGAGPGGVVPRAQIRVYEQVGEIRRLGAPVALDLRQAEAGGAWLGEAAPGPVRLLVDWGGRRGEYYRELTADREARVLPPFEVDRESEANKDMIGVEGGTVRVHHVGLDGEHLRDDEVEPFYIDVGCVTNRQWLDYLAAVGRLGEVAGDPRWDAVRGLAARDDWDELPATGMTWEEARAYAEWRGARLPTQAEWEFAVRQQLGDGPPFAEEIAKAWVVGEPGRGVDLTAYLEFAQPTGRRAGGLQHVVGNVWQWVEDPYPWIDAKGWDWRSELRLALGGAWAVPRERAEALGWQMETFAPAILGQIDIGFRCVLTRAL